MMPPRRGLLPLLSLSLKSDDVLESELTRFKGAPRFVAGAPALLDIWCLALLPFAEAATTTGARTT